MSLTPLELSQDALALIVSQAAAMSPPTDLPPIQWAQLGVPVMTCGSVATGVLNVREVALFDGKIQCGALLVADVTMGIARECAIEHGDDGHTDPDLVSLISAQMDKDSEVLSATAQAMPGKIAGANTSFQIDGGLSLVNMVVSTEVVIW